jgi:hypothetical protein
VVKIAAPVLLAATLALGLAPAADATDAKSCHVLMVQNVTVGTHKVTVCPPLG